MWKIDLIHSSAKQAGAIAIARAKHPLPGD
jgi:hypothetical protein